MPYDYSYAHIVSHITILPSSMLSLKTETNRKKEMIKGGFYYE